MAEVKSRFLSITGAALAAGTVLLTGCGAEPVTRTVTTEQITATPPPTAVVTTTTREEVTPPVQDHPRHVVKTARHRPAPKDDVVTEETVETGTTYVPAAPVSTTRTTTETTTSR